MKPEVLQLIGSFHRGGSERQALQLTRMLKSDGRYSIHLAALDGRGILRQEAEASGIDQIAEYPLTSFRDWNTAVQLQRFVRFLRQRRIDIIQTHDFYTNVFGIAAATVAGVPVRIASCRETQGMRTRAQKWVQRLAFRIAHAVVVNSEAVRTQLLHEGTAANKIEVVHNGIDARRLDHVRDLNRKNVLEGLALPRGDRRFVTIVANLRHQVKDIPTFLRAAVRVHALVPQSAFVVAGEGDLIKSLRLTASELGIGSDTFFIGPCSDIGELLAISEVCVLSSKAEGLSNAILEYMMAGRPVVATDVGGAREQVEEAKTGYLVPAADDKMMAERITMLLQNPDRAERMGQSARLVVQEKFSCRAQLEKSQALYDRLLLLARSKTSRPGASFQSEKLANRE